MKAPSPKRLRVAVRGAVQGVGFRPFVYRLAQEHGLAGWVNNSAEGVCLEVEGQAGAVESFLGRLRTETPPRSVVQSVETAELAPAGYRAFEIRASDTAGPRVTQVLPDGATCPECRMELFDPQNRRYRYPFTNCTHCGPRYTIIDAIPYDRAHTTMKRFALCPACQAEYTDPADRRYHAQPNACPVCGPQLALWDRQGAVQAVRDEALRGAVAALQQGAVVALKNLGGFHLLVDAANELAVKELRRRKAREEKPLALLFPSLDAVSAVGQVSELEARLLTSAEAPIVLLERRAEAVGLAPSVAPGNPNLGVMLPSNPLLHLLMADFGRPLVATSGNLSDEPICTDEREALERLATVADLFLVHDRPIARAVDDSIVRVVAGREMVLRRARGYAPFPVMLSAPVPPILAVGAHLKNTVALTSGRQVFISQHIGDLETPQAHAAFVRVCQDLQDLFATRPTMVACDLHPDYLSTRHAHQVGQPVVPVQHHYAHVVACLAENGLCPPALGVAWDGTGLGTDHQSWGGEFLRLTPGGFTRFATLRAFPLPGGDQAAREPRRAALGTLYEALGDEAFNQLTLAPLQSFKAADLAVLRTLLRTPGRCPRTTSVGRLFDAVAALLGCRQVSSFEGQAAMDLEFLLAGVAEEGHYEFRLIPGPQLKDNLSSPQVVEWVIDWEPAWRGVLADQRAGVAAGVISARFHHGLVEALVAVARRAGERQVALSGGCFQNRRLVERAVSRLRQEDFCPIWPRQIPPNDGGVAVGQAVAAAWQQNRPEAELCA